MIIPDMKAYDKYICVCFDNKSEQKMSVSESQATQGKIFLAMYGEAIETIKQLLDDEGRESARRDYQNQQVEDFTNIVNQINKDTTFRRVPNK